MTMTATNLGFGCCRGCGFMARVTKDSNGRCGGCGAGARAGREISLGLTASFLVTAGLLFVPANLLPVMTTSTVLRKDSDTIMTGVVALWGQGSWPLAILVFVASVVVPALKISALTLLVISSRRRSTWRQRERACLYRLVEFVGRWSMLDVFVMALLAALLRSGMANVRIEVGALAFAAVVVFTMLASRSFDPRLIWETEPVRTRIRTRI